MYTRCNRHIPFEECYDSIIDSIKYVLEKRVWEDPNSSLYNDPTGPDKAMHVAMKRQQGIVLSKYNAHRRLSNFNTLSLDEAKENYNDSAEGLLFGGIENNEYLKTFISEYFDNKDYLNAIFLDTICYSNVEYTAEKVVKFLKNLTNSDVEYYLTSYENINVNEFKKFLRELKDISSNYLKIKFNSLLYALKKEGNVYGK